MQPRAIGLLPIGRTFKVEGGYRTMAVLESQIDRSAPEYQENRAYFAGLVEELRLRTEHVRQGGGERAIAKHRARKKLLARERIELLCDPETPLLEFNPLAA